MTLHLLTGCYTPAQGGRGRGVELWRLDDESGTGASVAHLALDSPSFLAVSGWRVLAALEKDAGEVALVALTRGTSGSPAGLELLDRAPTQGASPCHVAFGTGSAVAVNYGGANAVAFQFDSLERSLPEGRLLQIPSGSGPVAGRQEAPHPHQAIFLGGPWRSARALVVDLGADRIVDPSSGESFAFPPGTGPRHAHVSRDFVLVAGELDSRVHALRRVPCGPDNPLGLEWAFAVPSFAGTPGDSIANYPSHVESSADGRFLYVGNRGRDTVSVFDLSEMDRGRLPLVQEASSGGKWPRHFAVLRHRLVVANEHSDQVTVLPRDEETGRLGDPMLQLRTGSPTCVAVVG